MHGLVCDFEPHLERIPREEGALIAFLGGTIGNFRPGPRRSFLARIATLMYPGDRFLLGTDLVKDTAVLEAAYNDSAGVTAEFNKNVLSVLNRELGADFDLDAFEHVAFFDAENEWIDIRLRSLAEQFIDLTALDMRTPLRPQRGDADRDLDQVHPRAARGELRRRRARAGRVVDRPRRASTRSASPAPPNEPLSPSFHPRLVEIDAASRTKENGEPAPRPAVTGRSLSRLPF